MCVCLCGEQTFRTPTREKRHKLSPQFTHYDGCLHKYTNKMRNTPTNYCMLIGFSGTFSALLSLEMFR